MPISKSAHQSAQRSNEYRYSRLTPTPNTHTVHLRDGHKWHVQYRDFSVIMVREDIVIRVAQGIHGSTNKW